MLSLSRRLLPVLQLTRMALVFTAIADSSCGLMLRWTLHEGRRVPFDTSPAHELREWLAVVMISFGLYGFGMSLNDIIDRRRDAQLAAARPLPSGRIGVITAHVICFLLGACALTGGIFYWRLAQNFGILSLILVIGTSLLIGFYDAAGKYLVGPGLLTLGLIRFFHALIPAPDLPLLWHPLLLLNHVAILSMVAYVWEEKRPALTPLHQWVVLGGLAMIDALAVGVVAWRRFDHSIAEAFRLRPGLLLPVGAVLLFILVAWRTRATAPTRRAAGQKLMLIGLLWLILYDACFAAAYVRPLAGLAILMLFPVAYFAVRVMRWWGQMLGMSQRPEFQRARS